MDEDPGKPCDSIQQLPTNGILVEPLSVSTFDVLQAIDEAIGLFEFGMLSRKTIKTLRILRAHLSR